MTEENEDFKFPEECPVCGSKERLLGQIIAKLKEEDKLSKDACPNGVAMQVPLIDQARMSKLVTPTIKIQTLVIFYDICAKCKTFIATGVQLAEMPAQVQMVPQGPRPVSLQGPRGDLGGSAHPF